ncbi:hypothetical protein NKR19_g5892 [Coniochaeta hoffmannii]|uniref:Uncharacterized protein n=1 Tax=Coniochaeta hoffmannii TaxID=91930 RepID=A0AA38VRU3_9PEZI|nr:hypothetical protein NKR19_g5892 [Coniochaeta hoffmannii]
MFNKLDLDPCLFVADDGSLHWVDEPGAPIPPRKRITAYCDPSYHDLFGDGTLRLRCGNTTKSDSRGYPGYAFTRTNAWNHLRNEHGFLGCGKRTSTTDAKTNATIYFSEAYASHPGVFDQSCKLESILLWSETPALAATCQSDPWNVPDADTAYVDSVLDLTACKYPRFTSDGTPATNSSLTTCHDPSVFNRNRYEGYILSAWCNSNYSAIIGNLSDLVSNHGGVLSCNGMLGIRLKEPLTAGSTPPEGPLAVRLNSTTSQSRQNVPAGVTGDS